MSEFSVPVIRIQKFGKHPNADTLNIMSVEGCPCIFRIGEFTEGDLAVYVPVEAVVPLNDPRFAFLRTKEGQETVRIKAKKLRGIFSMGVLVKPNPDMIEGQDAAAALGIVKYEEPEPLCMGTENESAPPFLVPKYDIESYRKYKSVLRPNERVIVTEKIHGTNSRFVWKDGKLWVGSHNQWKREHETNLWWRIARQHELAQKLQRYPGYVFYGETFGQVQDLKYGTKSGEFKLAVFDVFDSEKGLWMDWPAVVDMCAAIGLETVPVLYDGPYEPEKIEPLAEGKSTFADHVREGVVIKPYLGRWDQQVGRVIVKLVGEGYMLRKNGTEHH